MSALTARARRAPVALRAALPPSTGRRLVTAAVVALLLAALYLVVIRNSSLVAVDEVHVTGLTSEDSEEIRAAIEAAAADMTILHVRRDELEGALEAFPVVRGIDVSADFPDRLRVHVIEHHPAALVVTGSSKVPVAADGSVLRGLPSVGALARIEAPGAISADQIRDERMLGLLAVAGAAPGPLARRMESVARDGDRGVVVVLRDGPELVFGPPGRVGEKWRAAARVLADPTSQGAAYLDVRLPERPAAGGGVEVPVAPVDPLLTEAQP